MHLPDEDGEFESIYDGDDPDLSPFEEAPPPSDAALKSVRALALALIERTRAVVEAEAALKLRQEELRVVEEVELPDAMIDAGLSEFVLVGGAKVEIEDTWTASIPSDKPKTKDPIERARLLQQRARAMAYLAKEHPAVVKREIDLAFGRGEAEHANALVGMLRDWIKERKLDKKIGDRESVAPNTLGALVREMIANGVEFPRDDLGARQIRRAVISAPKGKKEEF